MTEIWECSECGQRFLMTVIREGESSKTYKFLPKYKSHKCKDFSWIIKEPNHRTKGGIIWRPDGWENPYNFATGGAIPKYEKQSIIFEAGADAMLEALRMNGRETMDVMPGSLVAEPMGGQIDTIKLVRGKLVFIPD